MKIDKNPLLFDLAMFSCYMRAEHHVGSYEHSYAADYLEI